MTSPSLELQGAIIARLKAYGALTSLVSGRVYDQVSVNAALPYVSLGPEQIVSSDAECINGFEIFVQIDAWSQAIGQPEVKRIAEAIRTALHNYELTLTDNALVSFEHRQTRLLPGDEQGQIKHAAVEFVAFIEQP